MSVHLVTSVFYPQSTIIHTVRDDLESFVWVLIWEYLSKAKARGCLSKHDSITFSLLASESYSEVMAVKLELSNSFQTTKSTPFARSLLPLISRWLLCAQSLQTPTSWDSVYEEFFSIAVECLDEARDWDSWDDFFGV